MEQNSSSSDWVWKKQKPHEQGSNCKPKPANLLDLVILLLKKWLKPPIAVGLLEIYIMRERKEP